MVSDMPLVRENMGLSNEGTREQASDSVDYLQYCPNDDSPMQKPIRIQLEIITKTKLRFILLGIYSSVVLDILFWSAITKQYQGYKIIKPIYLWIPTGVLSINLACWIYHIYFRPKRKDQHDIIELDGRPIQFFTSLIDHNFLKEMLQLKQKPASSARSLDLNETTAFPAEAGDSDHTATELSDISVHAPPIMVKDSSISLDIVANADETPRPHDAVDVITTTATSLDSRDMYNIREEDAALEDITSTILSAHPKLQQVILEYCLIYVWVLNLSLSLISEHEFKTKNTILARKWVFFITTSLILGIITFIICFIVSFRVDRLPRTFLRSIGLSISLALGISLGLVFWSTENILSHSIFYLLYGITTCAFLVAVFLELHRTKLFFSTIPYAISKMDQLALRLFLFSGLPVTLVMVMTGFLMNLSNEVENKAQLVVFGGYSLSTLISVLTYAYIPVVVTSLTGELDNEDEENDEIPHQRLEQFSIYHCLLAFMCAHASYFDPPETPTRSSKGTLGTECPLPSSVALVTFLDERLYDTQCLLVYSAITSCLTVSLRGTSSLRNAQTDVEVDTVTFDSPYVPKDVIMTNDSPSENLRVHRGFYKAYRSMSKSILAEIQLAVDSSRFSVQWILISGHSFGGAMGYFLALECRFIFPNLRIDMYNFGTPRMCNNRFAKLFNEHVPRCFRVVFERDPIPFLPRGFGYKHAGQECIIDRFGNLILCPTSIERTLLRQSSRRKDHKRYSYAVGLHALVSKASKQFSDNPSAVDAMNALLACVDVALSPHYHHTRRAYRDFDGLIAKSSEELLGFLKSPHKLP